MSSSRKTLARAISPTLREEEFEPASIDGLRDIPTTSPVVTSTNIGDVNVQFPDTLLWKRRFMMLDSQGFLILSPALSAKDQKLAGATRRMHMSEFRTPIIPDVEMQELPNSVVLDFVEGGSGLQIACEDRGGQGRILNSVFSLPCFLSGILSFRVLTSEQFSKMHTAHGLVISESTIHQASSPNLTTPPHTYTDLFAYNQLSCVFLRQIRSDTKSLLSSLFPSTSFDTTDRVISDQIQNTTHDELFLDTYTK
jgi:hypothetical protein